MIPLFNLLTPFVDKQGRLKAPWNSYLQQFTQAPPNMLDLTLTPSPFSYKAVEPGIIAVTGGTVSLIILTRGIVSVDVTGTKLIPVSIADTVTVTYSVAPNIQFIPSYGNRTG